MEIVKWYCEVLKNYTGFSGRARRKEFWYFTLLNIIITIVLGVLDLVTGSYLTESGIWFLSGGYVLALLMPIIAASIRRLHDTDRSGWWVIFSLVPIIGIIVFYVFMAQDSKPGENQYGLNPREVSVTPDK